jgi:beta-glucanase (GH16 family)
MTRRPLRPGWLLAVSIVCATAAFARANDVPTLPLANFEAGVPAAVDAFGQSIGFSLFQDGGGALELSTVAIDPGDPLALPGQDATVHALRIEHRIAAWGGFIQAFTDDAVTRWIPRDLSAFAGLRFWYAGDGGGGTVQVDLFDNRNPDRTDDSAERWFYRFTDDTPGWRSVEIPFASFGRRTDYQPPGAPNDGLGLDQASGWAIIFPPGERTSYVAHVQAYGSSGVTAADVVTVQFADALVRVREGDEAELRLVLSEPSSEAVSVRVILQGDTAVPLRSFVPFDQLVVFPPGVTEASVPIRTLFDGRHAGDLRAVARLDRPRGGALGFQRRAIVQIEDVDPFDPDLIADFADGAGFFAAASGTTLTTPELLAAAANARPGQARFESVLAFSWGEESGGVRARFPSAWDAADADGMEFWFFGDGSGRDVRVQLLAGRDEGRPWELAWSDEFDAPAGALPDPSVWTPEIGDGTANGIPGWGNAERQTYTNDPANVAHDGEGNLVIRALATGGDAPLCYYGAPCEYTSARITTVGAVEVAYGRIEARIRIPYGQGLWSAFWTLGRDLPTVGWPEAGEIDVMENIGREPDRIHGTIHGPGYSGANGVGRGVTRPAMGRYADDFHLYAVDWFPERIVWSLDGVPYSTLTPADLPRGARWVFDRPHYLILNVAVGGHWPGYPDATTTFPQEMVIDYVRVYQAADTAARYEATFADLTPGWTRVRLPFTALHRAAEQPEGAPDHFVPGDVVGVAIDVFGGPSSAMIDSPRWYVGD